MIWLPTFEIDEILDLRKTQAYGDAKEHYLWFYDNTFEYGEELIVTFNCDFDFSSFPFDTHVCNFTFGDDIHGIEKILLNSAEIAVGNEFTKPGRKPIVLKNVASPFEFELSSITNFTRIYDKKYSYTGLSIRFNRKSLGLLISGFYVPTGSFALVSLISYLINADSVSNQNQNFSSQAPKRIYLGICTVVKTESEITQKFILPLCFHLEVARSLW